MLTSLDFKLDSCITFFIEAHGAVEAKADYILKQIIELTKQSPIKVHSPACSGAFNCITQSSSTDQIFLIVTQKKMFNFS